MGDRGGDEGYPEVHGCMAQEQNVMTGEGKWQGTKPVACTGNGYSKGPGNRHSHQQALLET